MTTFTATQARLRLYHLLEETAKNHEPVQIKSKGSSVILIADDDWRAIQETLYLVSIPKMRESIRRRYAVFSTGNTCEHGLDVSRHLKPARDHG